MFSAKPAAEVTVLTCRNVVVVQKRGLGHLSGRRARYCDRHIGVSAIPVVETRRVLKRNEAPSPGCIAPWCRDCNRHTEYRHLTQIDERLAG